MTSRQTETFGFKVSKIENGVKLYERVRMRPRFKGTSALTSLPREILRHIVLELEIEDALSLALTCRVLNPIAEISIWRHLSLSVYSHCAGIHPRLARKAEHDKPSMANGPAYGFKYEEPGADAVRLRRGKAIKDKVKEIIIQADHRRLGLVRSVSLCQVEEAVHPTLQLLDFVSPTIEKLDLETVFHHNEYCDIPPRYVQSLDVKLLDYPLHFPSLTYIRLAPHSITFMETITVLCNAAPNLITLIAHMQHYIPPTWVDLVIPSFPAFHGKTKLRELRVDFREWDDNDLDRVWEIRGADDYYGQPADEIVYLLDHSPHLRQLSMSYDIHSMSPPMHEKLIGCIKRLEHLTDLWWPRYDYAAWADWRLDVITDPGERTKEVGVLPSLKRLMSNSCDLEKVFQDLPALPGLEVFYVNHRLNGGNIRAGTSTIAEIQSEPGALALRPSLAETLRACPFLHAIRNIYFFIDVDHEMPDAFARLEDYDESVIRQDFVRSLSLPDGSELFHVSIEMGLRSLRSDRLKHVYQDFTDFEGLVVPLDVIRGVGNAEGLAENWRGRGIEVGEAGVKVILDWKQKFLRDAQPVVGEAAVAEVSAGNLSVGSAGPSGVDIVPSNQATTG